MIGSTVPGKSKLTVPTRNSILANGVSSFEAQVSSIEDQVSSFETLEEFFETLE